MKKRFIFSLLAIFLAGFGLGGVSLAAADPCDDSAVAKIGDTCFSTLQEAISSTQEGNIIPTADDGYLEIKQDATFDLNGKKIVGGIFVYNGANVSIINGSIEGNYPIISYGEDTELTLSNFSITATNGIYADNKGKLVLNDGVVVNSVEFSVMAFGGSEIIINGGTYTNTDNFVVGTNGSNGEGDNKITINGGIFNGGISSEGYVACGIYVANSDIVEINGGTFNIKDGAGVVARGGITTLGEGVDFNLTTENKSFGDLGKVGDSNITVPVGYELVMDIAANYPGAATTFTTTNNLTGTYLRANNPYIVSIKDGETAVPVILTKDGISAKITQPANPNKEGYVFDKWTNGEEVTSFDFSATIASNINIVSNYKTAVAKIGNVYYESLQSAIDAATNNNTITLLNTITESPVATNSASYIIDLNSNIVNGKVVIAAGDVILTNGKITNNSNVALWSQQNAKVTLEDSMEIVAQEFAIGVNYGGELIVEGGTYTANDNCVIGTNGSNGQGNNTITINGGVFNGNITTAGYVACGIYVANDDTVVVNGGTFNIKDGAGIISRGGTTTLGKSVVFNFTYDSKNFGMLGKVGDSQITVPAGYELVMDVKANYPGASTTFTTTNNLTGTYLNADSPYVVSIKDESNNIPLTLTKDGTSAKISQPTNPSNGCNIFDGWFNGEETTAFDFANAVASNTNLKSKWTSHSCGGGSSPSSSSSNSSSSNEPGNTTSGTTAETGANTPTVDPQGVAANGYTNEMNEAYEFAYANGITTMKSIDEAEMLDGLTRIAMAKMLSQYAINVLGKSPADVEVPNFTDVSADLDAEYANGVSLAYKLGIMGINMPDNKFLPYETVTRAQFGTALSRLLFGIEDGEDAYYTTHLAKLKEAGIITNDDPTLEELRGYVMLMLMRSSKK